MRASPTIIDKPLYVYDIETFYDTFLFAGGFDGCGEAQVFEISWRRNQKQELLNFLNYLKQIDAFMVGYNNLGFDYPIIHDLMVNPLLFSCERAYDIAQKIIDEQKFKVGFGSYNVSLMNREIHQVDLMKIWHFDNESKRTRLKDLQFAMRSPNVMDLPYDFRKPLSSEQIDNLITYNIHDVSETKKFLNFTAERIKLRRDLITSQTLKGDVLNWNDTKIGEEFFISKLGRDVCYDGRKPRGTDRLMVEFNNVILPKIQFRKPEYVDVLETFRTKKWYKDDKDRNSLIAFDRDLNGMQIYFGSGGIHGSVNNKVYRESQTHKIIDIDVSGMYPAVGIANNFFPAHLGMKFVEVYKQLKFDRKQHKKGTAMNAVLKLAQNGAYGKSNSKYSPLFDTQYLFSITINGQLQNLQLFEALSFIPNIEFLQNNTDGMTVYLPREYEWLFDCYKKSWEKDTGLELEQVEYSAMYIADVNNYVAVKKDGSVKRIGKYWYARNWEDYDAAAGKWHTDVSMMIVPKIAEQVMLYGHDPMMLLKLASDPFDFMIRQKVKGQQKCYIGSTETQRTARYYVSKSGETMSVVRPPSGELGAYKRKAKITNKLYNDVLKEVGKNWDARIHVGKADKPDTQTRCEFTTFKIQAGWKVKDCCDSSQFNWQDLDYDFYLQEINKIIIKG